MTHRSVDEQRARGAPEVIVLLRRPPTHPRTAQGLRAAVGYLTVGLRVRVLLAGPATALLAEAPPVARRHLETLRALGQAVRALDERDLPELAGRPVAAW